MRKAVRVESKRKASLFWNTPLTEPATRDSLGSERGRREQMVDYGTHDHTIPSQVPNAPARLATCTCSSQIKRLPGLELVEDTTLISSLLGVSFTVRGEFGECGGEKEAIQLVW